MIDELYRMPPGEKWDKETLATLVRILSYLHEKAAGEDQGPFVIENRTSDPTNPATGQIWFRTDV